MEYGIERRRNEGRDKWRKSGVGCAWEPELKRVALACDLQRSQNVRPQVQKDVDGNRGVGYVQ